MQEEYTKRLSKIESVLNSKLPDFFSAQWQKCAFNTTPGKEFSQDEIEKLASPCRELLSLGGKRWRPLLQVLCGEMIIQANGENPELLENAYNLVPLVEFVHTASLIHDDIEDSADTRRGKPAAHITYGEDVAINAGSWLYFTAPMALEEADLPCELKLKLYRTFMTELRRLHLGQSMDINWHRQKDYIPTQEQYLTMVGLKTGTLAALAAKTGVLSCNGTDEQASSMAETARNIGIGFQVLDDVINLTTGNKGKKRGDDVVEGKKSLPVIFHVSSHPEDLPLIKSYFEKAGREGITSSAVEDFIGLLSSSDSIIRAKQFSSDLIENYCNKIVKSYPDSSISPLIRDLFISML